jgi:very-short-patch-repair endonuclease
MLHPSWDERYSDIAALVTAGSTIATSREALRTVLADHAWTTDVQATRQHLAAYGSRWLRGLKRDWRRANAMLKGLLAVPMPKSLTERLRLLDELIAGQKAAAHLSQADDLGRSVFGVAWHGDRSDWEALRRIVEWNDRCRSLGVSTQVRRKACSISDRPAVGRLMRRLRDEAPLIASEFDRLTADLRLDVAEAFGASSVDLISCKDLSGRLDLWRERTEELSKWIVYRSLADRARKAGLSQAVDHLADGRLTRETIIAAFEMAYYVAVLRSMVSAEPGLIRFDGDAHQRIVQEFRDIDLKRIELTRLEVAVAHYGRMPNRDGAAGPLGILRGEMARKIRHMPIRQLLRRAGPAIQAIKPVFMMSPLSIAQFLEPGSLHFDLLVVDEASQVQPVEALGAIARCNRMIIVGDDRQLPPTMFFSKLTGGEAEDDETEDGTAQLADIESILGLCTAKGVSNRMLRWHYRSRHHSLIAVSNRQFYDNKLYIVPSPFSGGAFGLRFNYIGNGIFDRGNTATNVVEARIVAEAVIHHARQHADLSLGVGTFSVGQRRAVLDELERLRRANPSCEDFFTRPSPEPFFVKNLENIQGDERDVIFISIGYGKDKSGYMAMQFGPLSAEGGERRLNVLISRAKHRCEVFSSITDEDIDLERGRGKGVAALKLFLNFARTGYLDIGRPSDREQDSVFEEQVAAALRAEGHTVHAQVGLAGFFIDLAIIDPQRPGRYVLGIECDGASYHSSRSARDRDRLRQAVLEDNGWIIHRIWSTDWFQRPEEQLRKTIAAIEAAKAGLGTGGMDARRGTARAVRTEIAPLDRERNAEITPERSVPQLSVPYREAAFSVPSSTPLHEVAADVMARIVQQIVAIEGPIHEDEIVVRVRSLWGLQRAGNRIQAAVARGLSLAIRTAVLLKEGSFYSVPGIEVTVRDRGAAVTVSLRKPEMLPPTELRLAIIRVVERNLGAGRDEIIATVSRLLGFKATSAQIGLVIGHEIEALIARGDLDKDNNGMLVKV